VSKYRVDLRQTKGVGAGAEFSICVQALNRCEAFDSAKFDHGLCEVLRIDGIDFLGMCDVSANPVFNDDDFIHDSAGYLILINKDDEY